MCEGDQPPRRDPRASLGPAPDPVLAWPPAPGRPARPASLCPRSGSDIVEGASLELEGCRGSWCTNLWGDETRGWGVPSCDSMMFFSFDPDREEPLGRGGEPHPGQPLGLARAAPVALRGTNSGAALLSPQDSDTPPCTTPSVNVFRPSRRPPRCWPACPTSCPCRVGKPQSTTSRRLVMTTNTQVCSGWALPSDSLGPGPRCCVW